ncbi:MAG: hypothetical protein ACJATI_001402 [Halioglobus sp.]|jgi:hypothetical protein
MVKHHNCPYFVPQNEKIFCGNMKIIMTLSFLCLVLICQAQEISKDVKPIEGITNLILDILSGPQGEKRDWLFYKSLSQKVQPSI